jgi:hypothetical protein
MLRQAQDDKRGKPSNAEGTEISLIPSAIAERLNVGYHSRGINERNSNSESTIAAILLARTVR